MTTPRSIAASRRPETRNSRATIAATIHPGTTPWSTRTTSTVDSARVRALLPARRRMLATRLTVLQPLGIEALPREVRHKARVLVQSSRPVPPISAPPGTFQACLLAHLRSVKAPFLGAEAVRRLGPRVPTLGVCLGHQAIVEAFGGEVGQARALLHGKASEVEHDGRGVFAGLPQRLEAGRYHSLAATRVPEQLEITARTPDGEVMGVRHRELPVEGVQFHPESVLTPLGRDLLRNFLEARP